MALRARAALLVVVLLVLGSQIVSRVVTIDYESPFEFDSFWRTPIPASYTVDPHSDAWIKALKGFGAPAYPKLVLSADFAQPYYVSTSADPAYTINASGHTFIVHIPKGATPNSGSDASLVVHDTTIGVWVGLWKAKYANNSWTASGADWYDDTSNGLNGSLPDADQPLNFGHRGVSGALSFVPKAQIDDGYIDHVLKVAIDDTGNDHFWPMTNDENRGGVIPEGVILRIKPEIDLSLTLSGAALVVAMALQDFGAIIGDTGNTPCALKLERDVNWNGLLNTKSLSKLTWDDFEFVLAGSRR